MRLHFSLRRRGFVQITGGCNERLALKHRRRMTFRYMTMCLIWRLHSAQSRPGLNIMMALSI